MSVNLWPPRHLTRTAAAVAITLLAITVAALPFGVTCNLTKSLPLGFYRRSPLNRPIARGDIVGVCLSPRFARLGLERGYLFPEGPETWLTGVHCPEGAGIVGKPVAGVPGDTVTITPAGVWVNRRSLAHSRIPPRDGAGRALPAQPVGTRVLGYDEYWIQSTVSTRSYDSRFFGPVREAQIVDVRVPLITLP